MRSLMFLVTLSLFGMNAFAGDNGFYEDCKSASGRTQLILGHVGGYDKGETIFLSIDGKTYGKMIVDNEVQKIDDFEGTVVYTELASPPITMLKINYLYKSSSRSTIQILEALDPRTGEALTHEIQVSCKVIYNPI